MTSRSSSERTLSDAILLEVGGLPGIRLWRQNAGLARGLHSEHRLRLAPAGGWGYVHSAVEWAARQNAKAMVHSDALLCHHMR